MKGSESADGEPLGGAPGRRDWLALLALLVVGVASTPLLWLNSYAPTLLSGGDGAIYIICAEKLLAGEGYTYLGQPFIIRPPGFSVFLMPMLMAFGRDYTVLTLAIWLSGIAGLGAIFWYLRPRLGRAIAASVCVVLLLNPFFRHAANQIMSDVPSLAALFGCLLLERRGRARPSLIADLTLGLAIAAATYLRSVHLLLLPALVLSRTSAFLSARPGGVERGTLAQLPRHLIKRALPVIGVAFVLLLPWKLREDRVAPEGVAELTRLHSYSVALLHADPADPDSPRIGMDVIAERFEKRSKDIAGTLGSRLLSDEPTPANAWRAIAAMACIAAVLALRRGAAEWFAFGTLFVISIYFGFMNRLMLPVFCIAVAALAEVSLRVFRLALPTRLGPLARSLTVALLLSWAYIDFDNRADYLSTIEQDYATFLQARDLVEANFGEDEVLSTSRSAHFCLELNRGVLNHTWPMGRLGEAGTLDFLERHGVTGLVLHQNRRPDRRLTEALQGRLEILGRAGPYTVARIASTR